MYDLDLNFGFDGLIDLSFFFMGFINHWFFINACVFAICFCSTVFSENPLKSIKSTPKKINQTKHDTCTPKLVSCFWQLGGRCSHCCPWNLLRNCFLIYLLNKKLVQETMCVAFMSTKTHLSLCCICISRHVSNSYINATKTTTHWKTDSIGWNGAHIARLAKRDGHCRSWWVLTGWFVYSRLYS